MAPEADLSGKVAVVTGGAAGLGAATARSLAAAGVQVLIADVDTEQGEAVAAEVDGVFRRVDVSSPEENDAMVAAAEQEFGGLDLVFLNAGVATGTELGERFDVERYRKVMGVNLDGVVFGLNSALPALERRGGGAIVATASLAGLTAMPMDPIYTANKHAVVGLVRSVGPVYEQRGIRINAVCPGYAETAIISTFRDTLVEHGLEIIPPQRVADTVLTLMAGPMSGECWFVQSGRDAAAFTFRNVPGPRPTQPTNES